MGFWRLFRRFPVPCLAVFVIGNIPPASRSFELPAGNTGFLSAERTICGKNHLAVAFLFSFSSFIFLSFGGISHTLSHLGRRTRVSAFSGKIRSGIFCHSAAKQAPIRRQKKRRKPPLSFVYAGFEHFLHRAHNPEVRRFKSPPRNKTKISHSVADFLFYSEMCVRAA